MARMFLIGPSQHTSALPHGGMSAVLLGDIMINRSFFSMQRVSRNSRHIEATPDHLVLQLYQSGGYVGEMGGRPITIARGQIAICDLRRSVDVRAMRSQTVGLTIPRHFLDGVNLDGLPPRLEPPRERILAAHMTRLHMSLPRLDTTSAADATNGLLATLRRLFDPSTTAGSLEEPELDGDLVTLARQLIASIFAHPDLSPRFIADRLRVSRATLYRAFTPLGGVKSQIWTMRLEAAQVALSQPAEMRTLSRLASDLGFKSLAHFSRSFRAKYGIAPSDLRAHATVEVHHGWRNGLRRMEDWWQTLGR